MIVTKIEIDIKKELLAMSKEDEKKENFYMRTRSTGVHPIRLYGLSNVHIKNCTMRPVLSLPGSSYCNLPEKVLANVFEKTEGRKHRHQLTRSERKLKEH